MVQVECELAKLSFCQAPAPLLGGARAVPPPVLQAFTGPGMAWNGLAASYTASGPGLGTTSPAPGGFLSIACTSACAATWPDLPQAPGHPILVPSAWAPPVMALALFGCLAVLQQRVGCGSKDQSRAALRAIGWAAVASLGAHLVRFKSVDHDGTRTHNPRLEPDPCTTGGRCLIH